MRAVEFVGWFSAGCGLAVVAGIAGHTLFTDAMSSSALTSGSHPDAAVHVLAQPGSGSSPVSSIAPASEVPIQRPRGRTATTSMTSVDPFSLPSDPGLQDAPSWSPDDARLPPGTEQTRWNPDDARLPELAFVASWVPHAHWNPNSATLPTAVTPSWDPDDARLPLQ